jgi:hypothetical protein
MALVRTVHLENMRAEDLKPGEEPLQRRKIGKLAVQHMGAVTVGLDGFRESQILLRRVRGRTPTLPPAYRLPETSLDAEANGRETMLHQALSRSAGHFVAQRLRVSSCQNKPTCCSRPRQRRNYRLAVS